jgi:hypothetical protein
MSVRFCDLCAVELPEGERYYHVLLRVRRDPDDDGALDQESAIFCDGCTTSGRALVDLLQAYEERATDVADARSPSPDHPSGRDRA